MFVKQFAWQHCETPINMSYSSSVQTTRQQQKYQYKVMHRKNMRMKFTDNLRIFDPLEPIGSQVIHEIHETHRGFSLVYDG